MKRREFLVFTAAAASWPNLARAQAPRLPIVGFLNGGSPAAFSDLAAAFRGGLKEAGFVEGQNVTIEYRWAEGDRDRMPALAADLLQGQLKVVTVAGPHLNEHKQIFVQKGIPTVGTFSTDPSGTAAIQNLARTGVNITGATTFAVELEAKRCALLAELLPRAQHFGVFCRREDPNTDLQIKGIETVARSTGRQFELVNVSTEADIEKGYAALRDRQAEGLVITATPFFNINRVQLAALSARYAMPTIHEAREFVEAGGLMSFGPRIPSVYRQLGIYAGLILKGEKASDLPIVQPTTFYLAVNLKVAEALKVEIPSSILARADTVIE